MMDRHTMCSRFLVLIGMWFICTSAVAESEVTAAFEAGKNRFEENCGICHGLDGKGMGAFSELLKVAPPDLTVLTKRNNGYFPFTDIYNAIDGRNIPLAHGREGMPIWGDRYKQAVADGSETLVRGRILELILYLQWLQEY
jgi:mono/diheme cytochrome c family protein